MPLNTHQGPSRLDLLSRPIADLIQQPSPGVAPTHRFDAPAGRLGGAGEDSPVVVVPIFSMSALQASAALDVLALLRDASPVFRPVIYTDADVIQSVRRLGWALEHHFAESAWPGGPHGWARHVIDRAQEIASRYGSVGFASARLDRESFGLPQGIAALGMDVCGRVVGPGGSAPETAGADSSTAVGGYRGWLGRTLMEGGRRVVTGYRADLEMIVTPGGRDIWWVSETGAGPEVEELREHGIGHVRLTSVRGQADTDVAIQCLRAALGDAAVLTLATSGTGDDQVARAAELGADYHADCDGPGQMRLRALDPGLAAADGAVDLHSLAIHAAIRRELRVLGGRWAS